MEHHAKEKKRHREDRAKLAIIREILLRIYLKKMN